MNIKCIKDQYPYKNIPRRLNIQSNGIIPRVTNYICTYLFLYEESKEKKKKRFGKLIRGWFNIGHTVRCLWFSTVEPRRAITLKIK